MRDVKMSGCHAESLFLIPVIIRITMNMSPNMVIIREYVLISTRCFI